MLDLAFRADRESGQRLPEQLAAYLRRLVEAGRLAAGEKLPATRELAASLELGRNSVAQAYEQLCDEGLLTAHVGQGTFVASRGAGAAARGVRGRPAGARSEPAGGLAWEALLSRRALALRMPEGAAEPGEIRFDFRPGGVDPDEAPQVALRRAFSRALSRHGRALADHRDPAGWPPLRAAIARSLLARGIEAGPEEVLVTSGAQQALDLVARCLVDPGDAVALEQPGYFGAALAFGAAGARLLGIPVDERGLRTDALARALRGRRLKLVFTTPAVQSPTGVVLDEARRAELLALADEHQTPVLEDDYDSELRAGTPPVAALKTRDPAGLVVYTGTFSKAVLPGLRVGYVLADAPLRARLSMARLASDLGTHVVAQAALAELLECGDLERHVRRARRRYTARLRALDAALAAADLPEGARWRLPAGGNALWLRLPPAADPDAVWRGLLRAGLAAVRGDVFSLDGGARDHLLLGVAGIPGERIAAGAARLAEVVKDAARGRAGRAAREGRAGTRRGGGRAA